jgi:hypothetical protein
MLYTAKQQKARKHSSHARTRQESGATCCCSPVFGGMYVKPSAPPVRGMMLSLATVPEPATSLDTAVLTSACPTCRATASQGLDTHQQGRLCNNCALHSDNTQNLTMPPLLAVKHTLQTAALQPCAPSHHFY